jgi:hypothetical protein
MCINAQAMEFPCPMIACLFLLTRANAQRIL